MYSVIVCVDLEQYHLLFISQYELLLNHLLTGCKTINNSWKANNFCRFSFEKLRKRLQNITNLLQILTVMSAKASYHNYSWFAWHWNILQKSGTFSQNRSTRPWKNSSKLREIWIKRKPTVNNVKYFLGVVWVTKVTQDTENSCHWCHPTNWLQ